MPALLIVLAAGAVFVVAYHTYGRWLARHVFELAAGAVCPSKRLEDGQDYVPTKRAIVFGHHFTSIAGTGPIVGPAIAVMWGWLPALLWVVLGSVLIGAVHDFGSLVVSLRNDGQTVGDIAGRVMNRRVRFLFLLVLFMALTIVLAIFGLVIAGVFRMYPAAITPCLIQIPIAVVIGVWLHRQGKGILMPSLLALVAMYATVIWGNTGVLGVFNEALATMPNIAWVVLLLFYSYVASVLPVWSLLQPRDYINSLQLLSTLALIVVGLGVAAFWGGASPTQGIPGQPLHIAAPMFNPNPQGAPPMIPFLFITIACGAISGFHCLVSSGTSSKQLEKETDAQFVGFGSMLIEGFLATLVIVACVAGLGLGVKTAGGDWLTGAAAFEHRYAAWGQANSLGAKVGGFVDGSANLVASLGISASIATALMAVLVASFAGTTLDTACRLQRYVVQELAATFARQPKESQKSESPLGTRRLGGPLAVLGNKHGATLFAVVAAGLMAWAPLPGQGWSVANAGKGGLILWPMFGATNQLLGGLAFLVISFWLMRNRKPVWFVMLPLVFMLVMPAWAMLNQLPGWWAAETKNGMLIVIALATLALEGWMVVEAVLLWLRFKPGEAKNAPPASLT